MDQSAQHSFRSQRKHRSWLVCAAVLATFVLLSSACSGGDTGSDSAAGETPEVAGETTIAAEPPGTGECDNTDPTMCLLPWPSDAYTRIDPSTETGLRLDLPEQGMPTNVSGKAVDPLEWNRNDGFSPATIAQIVIEDIDPVASALASQNDIAASMESNSNLVLVDVDNGERIPAWAEVDISVTDPNRAPLRIIPAIGLTEGHRHSVGLFDLLRSDGSEVEPSETLAEILDAPSSDQELWLNALGDGRPLDGLDAGWSFTVASTEGLTGRLRHMWSETATELGVDLEAGVTAGGAPPFTIDMVEESGPARVVQGSFEMPNYLTGDGSTGEVLNNEGDHDGIPSRNGTMDAPFT
ncbi:MAG: hypothetical protein ACR2OH_10315, partial [Microthrixaceae bacterium]